MAYSSSSPSATSSPMTFRPSMLDALSACSVHEERCAYPSKPCPNARAVKLNGDRHNFCEFHRKKANMNQRRWQQRRRRMRHIGDAPMTSPVVSAEMESAQAVVMLQQSAGRYSPMAAQALPRYSLAAIAPTAQWAPRPSLAAHSPIHQAPYRPGSVNLFASSLPRAVPYTHQPLPPANMIPQLRTLPPLLPSVLVPGKSTTSYT